MGKFHQQAVLSAILCVGLVACGGGGGNGEGGGTSGGDGTSGSGSQPTPGLTSGKFDYVLAPGVIDIPASDVGKYEVDFENQTVRTTDSRPLAAGFLLKIGQVAIKLGEATSTAQGRAFQWEPPTPDEMFDSFDVEIPGEVNFDMSTAGFDAAPKSSVDSVTPKATDAYATYVDDNGWRGFKFAFSSDVAAKSKLSGEVMATGRIRPGLKVTKTGRGDPVRSSWILDLSVKPRLQLGWVAGDVLDTSARNGLLEKLKMPPCVQGGLFGLRDASKPGTKRLVLTGLSIPKPTGVPGVGVIMPVCAAIGIADSRIGVNFLGSADWRGTITKTTDQTWPTLDAAPPTGALESASSNSLPSFSASGDASVRLEAMPTLMGLYTIPLTGVAADPGVKAKLKATFSVPKKNVCAGVDLEAAVQAWHIFTTIWPPGTDSTGKERRLVEYTRTLVENYRLVGDECGDDDPPVTSNPAVNETPIPAAGSPVSCPSDPARDFVARANQLGFVKPYIDSALKDGVALITRADAYAIDLKASRYQGFTLKQVVDDIDNTLASFAQTRSAAWENAHAVAASADYVNGLRRNGLPADFQCSGGVNSMACLGTSVTWSIEYLIDLRRNTACYYQ